MEPVTSWQDLAIEKPGIWMEKMDKKEKGRTWNSHAPFDLGGKRCWLDLGKKGRVRCLLPL